MVTRECAVCFQDTTHASVPCEHPLCTDCAAQWYRRRSACPCCRQTPASHTGLYAGVVSQLMIDGHPMGMTVVDAPGGGVLVTHLHCRDRAFQSGVRAGDVLCHINGLPALTHDQAVAILETARAMRMEKVYIGLATSKRRKLADLVRAAGQRMRSRARRSGRSFAVRG